MDMISGDVLDEATELFHAALDKYVNSLMHGREGDWVDGSAEAVVEALLLDGWRLPESESQSARAMP